MPVTHVTPVNAVNKRTVALLVALALLLPAGVLVALRVQENGRKARLEFARELETSIQTFVAAGKVSEARDVARHWSQVQPDSADAWREYGALSATLGDLDTAESSLRKSLSLRSDDGEANLALGEVLLAKQQYLAAGDACQQALEKSPENPRAKVCLAQALIALGRELPRAEEMARAAVRAEAGVAVAHFTLAQALLARQNGLDARAAVLRGLALDPANATGYQLLALACAQSGDVKGERKARETAEVLRNFAPGAGEIPAPVQVAMGGALLESGKYREALGEFIEVIRRDRTDAGALEGAGIALWQLEKKAAAAAYLSEALRHDSGRVRTRIALALAAFQHGQFEGAARLLKPLTAEQPNNAMAWHLLGRARAAQLSHDAEAEAALRQAVRIGSSNPTYLMDLADILQTNNRLAEAERAFREALALTPDDPEVCGRFGAFLGSLPPSPKKQTEARRLLEKALQLTPDNPYCQYHLGKLLVGQEKYQEGVSLLESASSNGQGRTKDVWSVLARGYQKLGRTPDALAALAHADRIQQENTRYDRAIERLASDLNNPQARLEMARAAAVRGESARALAEYASYLRRKPDDTAVVRERDNYAASLKKAGNYPDMDLYTRLNAAVVSRNGK